jgi:hypothetical protein
LYTSSFNLVGIFQELNFVGFVKYSIQAEWFFGFFNLIFHVSQLLGAQNLVHGLACFGLQFSLVQASILHFPSTLQSSDWDQACAIM